MRTPKIKNSRRPVNEAEGECYDRLRKAGWLVSKRGWPDFFCMHPEKGIALIEVKPQASNPLKKSQINVMRMLASYGVPCWRWDPVKGFERIPFDIEGTVEGARQGRPWKPRFAVSPARAVGMS